MVKDSVNKIKRLVNGFSGLAPIEDIQSILVEFRVIEGYFNCSRETKKQRVHFPKHFSIKTDRDYIRLQEVTPSETCYCSDVQYDIVASAILYMQERRENFNRFTLPAEIQKSHTEVTTPAVLACLHYWLSMPNPLLAKEKDLFKIKGDIDEFVNDTCVAWDDLADNDLYVPKTGRR